MIEGLSFKMKGFICDICTGPVMAFQDGVGLAVFEGWEHIFSISKLFVCIVLYNNL